MEEHDSPEVIFGHEGQLAYINVRLDMRMNVEKDIHIFLLKQIAFVVFADKKYISYLNRLYYFLKKFYIISLNSFQWYKIKFHQRTRTEPGQPH